MSDSRPASAAVDDRAERRGGGGLRDWLALGAAWIPYSFLVGRMWFVTDDAYISFRYARHWAAGAGLRYNLGDQAPVEGFSNFLWVALTTLVELAGLDPVRWMPGLSTLAGFALTALLFRALRESYGLSRAIAAATVAVLGCATPFAVWTTGGLETMSFSLLLFLVFRALVLRPGGASGVQGGAFGLLVALSRPEGVYWVLVVLALAVFARRRRGEPTGLGSCAAILLVGYAAYQGWRFAAFGHLLPTSATAKLSAGVGLDRIARGARYVTLQFLSTASLFALVPAGWEAIASRRRAGVLPAFVLALGFPAWAVLVSGDFMAFGRFLVPGLPFLALPGGLLLARIAGPGERRLALAFGAALVTALLGALPAWNVYVVPRSVREQLDFRPHLEGFRSEYAYWRKQRLETERWVQRGRVLARISEPGDSIVLSAIGAVGYYSGLFVHDRLGLVTREVAELEPVGDARDRTPGHDNPVEAQWFLDRGHRPTFIRANFHRVGERSELADKVARAKRNLEANRLTDSYVLEVWRVLPAERSRAGQEGLDYFFVWRRIPDGVAPRVAWDLLDQRMERHIAGGDLPTVELGPGE